MPRAMPHVSRKPCWNTKKHLASRASACTWMRCSRSCRTAARYWSTRRADKTCFTCRSTRSCKRTRRPADRLPATTQRRAMSARRTRRLPSFRRTPRAPARCATANRRQDTIMHKNFPVFAMGAALLLLLLVASAYTVYQRQAAIRFRLGEVVAVQQQPGLYFKVPLIENIRLYDTLIQTLDTKDAERIQTKEKNNVLVDSFVKYRIVNVRQFFVSTGGDLSRAELRLSQKVNDDLRAEFGQRTLAEVISGERDKIMEKLRTKTDADARSIAIEVRDVRLNRVDLVPEISADVYRRMDSERKRVANELRSTGSGEAEKIRADAERQREIIIAEATRDAQKVKGDGDAQASRIYAQAYNKNPEFYSFYRSLEAYKSSFRNRSDVLVLEPSSDFFKYLKNPNKGKK